MPRETLSGGLDWDVRRTLARNRFTGLGVIPKSDLLVLFPAASILKYTTPAQDSLRIFEREDYYKLLLVLPLLDENLL